MTMLLPAPSAAALRWQLRKMRQALAPVLLVNKTEESTVKFSHAARSAKDKASAAAAAAAKTRLKAQADAPAKPRNPDDSAARKEQVEMVLASLCHANTEL